VEGWSGKFKQKFGVRYRKLWNEGNDAISRGKWRYIPRFCEMLRWK